MNIRKLGGLRDGNAAVLVITAAQVATLNTAVEEGPWLIERSGRARGTAEYPNGDQSPRPALFREDARIMRHHVTYASLLMEFKAIN